MLTMWGYLFLYGAPDKPREVFSNLGFRAAQIDGSTSRTVEGTLPVPKDATRLSLGTSQLEQITTKAVAGFTFLADEPEVILYAERGTGHVFEIDFATGLERQISLTTIPGTVSVVFSEDGSRAAFTTHEGYTKKTSTGNLVDGDSMQLMELRSNAEDITFLDADTVAYTTIGTGSTVGYSRNAETFEETKLFEVALGDSITKWSNGKTVIQPKPTHLFEGALYEVQNSKLSPLTKAASGFYGFLFNAIPVYSMVENKQYKGAAALGAGVVPQGIVLLDEKCAEQSTSSVLWCAAPLVADDTYLESWYKGTITSEDYIWKVNITSGSTELVGDIPKLGGKTLDVLDLTQNQDGSKILFINKIDNTLWIYRTKE